MALPLGLIERRRLRMEQLILDLRLLHWCAIGGFAQQFIDRMTDQRRLVDAQGTDMQ